MANPLYAYPDDAFDEEGVAEEAYVEPAVDAPATPDQIETLMRWADPEQTLNIADEIDEGEHGAIAMKAVREAEIDEQSRHDWLEKSKKAMDLAMQVVKAKTWPWPEASNIIYPLMTEAADQFAARAYPAIVSGRNVVKGVVYGDDEGEPLIDPSTGQPVMNPQTGEPIWQVEPGSKRKIADRIAEHMSWQLLEEQPEWEEETDKLLHVLPLVGCAFRKTYFDPVEGRNFSVLVFARDLIIDYWAKSILTAPRLTECVKLYPYQIEEAKRSGYFLNKDYGRSLTSANDDDAPVDFYEQHRRLDLDGDGYPEPYIVTVAKESQQLARIVARYDPEGVKFSKRTATLTKIEPVSYYTKYDFMPNKEGGIYGVGFGQTLAPINEATNSALNQLVDAGTLSNMQGGFIGKNLSMRSGNIKIGPGQWNHVNALGQSIRDAIVPFDYKAPSPVLFQLLGMLIEAGRDISSVKDVLTGEVKAQTMSPTVFLAMVDQGLKVFTAIYKRVYRSLKADYDKQFRLNRIYLEEQSRYRVGKQWRTVQRSDYDSEQGVEPISDPSMVSDAQKMARSDFLIKMGANDPLMDQKEIRRRALAAADIEDIDKILKDQPEPNPAMIAQLAEIEAKVIQSKADALNKLASAVKNLAEADAKVMEPFMQWAATNIQALQVGLDAIGQHQSNAASGGQGPDGGGVPAMEAPPGLEGVPQVPMGHEGPSPAVAPGAMGSP